MHMNQGQCSVCKTKGKRFYLEITFKDFMGMTIPEQCFKGLVERNGTEKGMEDVKQTTVKAMK